MSLQLTLARAAARDAEADWGDHKRHCPACTHATRSRHLDLLCPAGVQLRTTHTQAQADLTREQKAEKAPIAGQETLF